MNELVAVGWRRLYRSARPLRKVVRRKCYCRQVSLSLSLSLSRETIKATQVSGWLRDIRGLTLRRSRPSLLLHHHSRRHFVNAVEPWRPSLRAVFTRKSARDRGRPLSPPTFAHRHKAGRAVATRQRRYEEDTRRPRVPLLLKKGERIVNRSSTIETMSRFEKLVLTSQWEREGEGEEG